MKSVKWFSSSVALILLSITLGVNNSSSQAPSERAVAAATTFSLKNWGIVNEKAKSHIQALDAWKISQGSEKIVVAVIDTGIDAAHPDLKNNLWKNPNSQKDEYGWNFVDNRPNPYDEHGHGTHVAGIIGGLLNKQHGTSGVAQKVSIMPVKYFSKSSDGSTNLRNTVKAIKFAIDSGAKIINYSGGGPEFSQEEKEAIIEAERKGILFVAAAGNDSKNIDVPVVKNSTFPTYTYYPAAYGLSNIITVTATDIDNKILPSSNYGKLKVDVAAPGENILSTVPGGRYDVMTGTSQATAFVTGLAVLLLAKDPTLTPVQIKKIITGSVDHIPGLAEKTNSGGRINALGALKFLENLKTKPSLFAKAPTGSIAPGSLFLTTPTTSTP